MDETAAGVVREDYEEEEMRLIDADALVSALNNGRLKEQTGRAVPFNAGVAFALTMVEYAQTIDAVPVVRCKDCRYWDEHSQYGYDDENGTYGNYCMIWTPDDDFYAVETPEDGFCYNGERKDHD